MMSSRDFPFESVARRHPSRPALRQGDRTFSYRELDELSGALAGEIARATGPGEVVAVTGHDRPAHVVGLLAVLRAGRIHLPLDPQAPEERNARLLADTGAAALLTDGLLGRLPGPSGRVAPGPGGYVIHTSGTTGRPKGVCVPLDALSAHLGAAAARFGLTEHDVVLQFARPTVDVAIEQVLTALTTGACVLIPEQQLLTPAELLDLLDAGGVTVANLAAGYFQEVVAELRSRGAARAPRSLRLMISGSDRLHPGTAADWRELTGVPLLNAYGPTETTITATVHDLSDGPAGEVVPIGAALGKRTLHVLDERLRPCPPGTAGELYVGGPVLAWGYWGRPGPTAERFVADPYAQRPGARMYRTGDVVRRAAPGAPLEYVGRGDHQVKIRGFRVEPGEIEAALAALPGVGGCVVTAHEGRLAAYVTGEAPDYARAREFLAGRLPEHMIPASLTALDAFPLTPGGKIDRAALPAPALPAAKRSGHRPPRTAAEQLIAAVWSDVLGVPEVGADDNFFHLGGDSLTAVRVVGRVYEVFGMVSPYTIFDAPTLAEFAAAVTASAGPGRPALTRRGLTRAPLSKFQRGLWVLDQWNPGAATYNVPWVLRFDGQVDPLLLRGALEGVVARHESLRTTFELGEAGPEQVVHERIAVPFTLDLVAAEQVDALIAGHAREPFDLESGPLLRAHALRTPDGATTLLLVVHHIVWDEGSLAVLEHELQELYAALLAGRPHRLPELPVQYADHSAWQYEDDGAEAQLAYWQEQLKDAPQNPALPTDHPRPELQAFRGAYHRFTMATPVARALRAFARSEDATPFMVLLAGLALTLHRRSGERDLVVGTPVSLRGRTELDGLIGYFVNLLPLRLKIEEGASFRELVRHVREVSIGGYRHQEAPFDDIAGLVLQGRPEERQEDRNPLCQVVLELHPLDPRPLTIGDAAVTRELYSNDVSRFDLSISVDDRGTGFTGRFEYDSDLFDPATVAELCDSWTDTLAAAVDPAVHTLFEARAEQAPDATALLAGDTGETLSYAELNRRANRLAHFLTGRGVTRGSVVAILVERGPDLVTGLLAVLKTGAAYTLLDPDFPAERLAGAVADSAAGLVLTHRRAAAPFEGVAHLDLDAVAEQVARCSDRDQALPATGDDLACVMFTSGSTGRPKGVAASHHALTTTYLGQDYAHFGPEEVWLQCSPVSWDAFALELYGALLFGGSCVLQPGQRPDPETIAALTTRHGVTQLQLSASLFNFLLEEFPATFDRLKVAFTAGERASVTHVAKALENYPGLAVANGYGPVESLGLTTCHRVGADDLGAATVPIGRALNGKAVHVLDEDLQPVGPGVTGELYAAGGGLAYGYVAQPALTAGRFVADPYGRPGERLYRTGDLGHRTADGTLEITGRIDDQIKIRGFRVEPGEIEDALTRHPGVRESAVTVHEPAPGDRRLAAYITAGPVPPDIDALLAHLAGQLPEYMVPATVDILDALPLNPNGKTDRRALPAPARAAGPGGEDALTGTERLVADAVREVLDLARVGRDDNFFRIGGNSLAAVRVAMRLSRETGTRVPPHVVFRARTVSAIAARLAAAQPQQ